MKKLISLLPFALLLSFVWLACRKDNLPTAEPTVDVAFAGQVTDENNQPLADASVRAGGLLARTDANGVFRLPPVRMPARDAKISVTKIGYFEFTRSYIVEDEALKIVDIQLLARTQVGSVNGAQGGVITVPGGASLTFPADAVRKSGGGAYSGTVRVYAYYLDPTSPELVRRMPGDLRAVNASGDARLLTTYGMLAVELSGNGGEDVQVADGKTGGISLPIPPGQQASAPAEIPLWWFDAEQSRWIEEGNAQKTGDRYVGQVAHFTWWNCDVPGPLVQMSGSVFLGDEQHPLANLHVWVCPTDVSIGWGCSHGTTDFNGAFSGGVPQGVPLRIDIQDECGSIIFSQAIGTFDADGILPPIIIADNPAQDDLTITGRLVDCFQQPVTIGYARIRTANGAVYYAYTDNNGNFSHTFSCTLTPGNIDLVGYDLALARQTQPSVFSSAALPVALGELEACDNLTEFIRYILDGEEILFAEPTASSSGLPTWVYAFSGNDFINFGFENNGQTGTFPLVYFANSNDSTSAPLNITTTLSEFGGIGEPIIGTFDGTYQSGNGTNHTVSGNYRILRE